MKWLTANGEYLRISKMKVSHILHCIELLKRSKFPERQSYISEFKNELKRRNIAFSLYDQDGRFISFFKNYADAETYRFLKGNSWWIIKSIIQN